MERFHILLFDGCEELDVFGPWDTLQSARSLGAPFEVSMGTAGPAKEIRMAFGARLSGVETLAPRAGDWVIVPGGGWNVRAASGAWGEVQRGELPKILAAWHATGVFMASVCTGALLLGAAGITKGRCAATHHGAREDLAAMGVSVVSSRVVDDGDLLSAGGVTSGIDLGLYLVERLVGASLRESVRERLEYVPTGEVHFGPKGKPPR
ncbi:MAG: DJ-1/PfpI family protein [Deltaproteobacteria bacterium]|nr:DJ-1/PfpI family protein [Deltaproteobacteria bacterium]